MEFFLINLLNGLSYGLLLFMLSAGLTLIFSMLGVLNFAHASFYMLGAYLGYSFSGLWGYWYGLLIAPIITACLGMLVERFALRRLHVQGQLAELLFTFGLAYVMLEIVQLIWGKLAIPYRIPDALQGTLFTVYSSPFTIYRGFVAVLALAMLGLMYLVLGRTRIGLVIQAALTQPRMVEALGHNVPRIFMWIFGLGCGLAGLAGAVGGNLLVTEPGMAANVGSIIFVVIVLGGIGSLSGSFLASMLIALLQTFAVTSDLSLLDVFKPFLSAPLAADNVGTFGLSGLLNLRLSQMAPVLPFIILLLMLIWRPHGLFGTKSEVN
ncbi:branched-chain amino acid ABC transporter permease [Undibacterium flavidum]|uniref:Branched-chain amino acid ABC transporter permease n=1 Tax=Undibacterium flavidum TaxID=2762297 RepID=A0ABR6YFT8_9BURK|nr:branched-chain amino acid ABC transporter permease [Undibacterium flavidum]MBC3875429.1 branched-chain amino acid ABC transporter permease [Undibacterium flavidum]